MAGALKDKAVGLLVRALGVPRESDPEVVAESPEIEAPEAPVSVGEPSLIEKARAKAAEDDERRRQAKIDDQTAQRKQLAIHASRILETQVTPDMLTARADTINDPRPTGGLRFHARFDSDTYHYPPPLYMHVEKGPPKTIYQLTDVLK